MVAPRSLSAALTFGGLSFDECRHVFFSPNGSRLPAELEATLSCDSRPAAVASARATLLTPAPAFDSAPIPASACDGVTISAPAAFDAVFLPAASSAFGAATLSASTAFEAVALRTAAAGGACQPAALSTAAMVSVAVSYATAAFCKLMRETSLCPGPPESSLCHLSCDVALCSPAPRLPVGREPQGQGLVASLSEPVLLEWPLEQGKCGGEGAPAEAIAAAFSFPPFPPSSRKANASESEPKKLKLATSFTFAMLYVAAGAFQSFGRSHD
ncbi:unnamed protein product [Closterium sp. Naga37s-1]|nr:unnamed protein product [Closterium sp. Naga37s-1]